uniref:Bug family tripartite tricarboxylate transporter substrate binding protein n=1 Tax=Neoroseomonas rubea TaxID=2748666 RepID=UPI0018E00602
TIRRRALLAAPPAASLAAAPRAARAQAPWPDRPIRLVVPTAGGAGTADTLSRIMAQEFEARLGQRVVVENRAGANGNVGAAHVARSAPDGATFLWGWAGTLATNPSLYASLPFDPVADFDPVALVGNVPNILVVNRDLGPRTLAEFTAFARAHPGRINFGSTGNGSSMHLAGELYRQMTNTEMQHVPYSGPAAAVTDLLSGRIQAMFNLLTGALPQVQSAGVVPVAVLADQRVPQLPDVPTAAEAGLPGLSFGTWFMVLAPKGTPAPILDRMNALANEIIAAPEPRARLQAAGMSPLGGTREDAARFLAAEIELHRRIVRASGARID